MQREQGAPPAHRLRRDIMAVRRSLAFLVVVVIAAVLYFAQDIFLPLALAVVLALVFRPVSRALGRAGAPAPLSAAMIVLALFGMVALGFYLIAEPAQAWVSEAPRIAIQIQYKFRDLISSADAVGKIGEQVQDLAKGGKDPNVQEVVVREPGLLTQAASGGANLAIGGFLCLALLYFLLASADALTKNVIALTPRLTDKVRALRVGREIEREVSHYLFAVTIINFCLGAAVALAMTLVGLPNPLVWGVMAMALNFVPYVGSLVGVGIVLAVSAATFDAPGAIVLPPLAYFALTALEGQLVTPTVLGRRLRMNPVAILLSVALWSWLWGVMGAVLAVPLLLIVKVAADHLETWEPLAVLLSAGQTRPAEDASGGRAA